MENSGEGGVYTTFTKQGNYQQYLVFGSCCETPSTSITLARDTKRRGTANSHANSLARMKTKQKSRDYIAVDARTR